MATEKRQIDAEEILVVICDHCPDKNVCPTGGCAEFVRIYNLLAFDSAPVVRCKDCTEYGLEKQGRCYWWMHDTKPDDFCSYGERK